MNNKATLRIGWILLFFTLAFLGDRIGGKLLDQAIDKSGFRYSRMYNDCADADILLLGNSRGLGFYQPYIEEITQKSTFNLSYNGMPIELGAALVKDYLEKYEKPEVVVIDVTMCDRANDQLIAGFASYMTNSEHLSDLIRTTNKTNYLATQFSHLYRYNSEVFQRALYYSTQPNDEHWIVDRTIAASMIEMADAGAYDYRIDAYGLEELKALIELIQQQNIRVELIVSPYFPAFRAQMGGLDEFISIVSTTTNLPVHDYSESLMKPAYFGDFQHINKKGSEVFMKRLKQDGIF